MMLSDLINRKCSLTEYVTEQETQAILNEINEYFLEVNVDEEDDAFSLIPEEAETVGMFVTVDTDSRKYEHYFYKMDRLLIYLKFAYRKVSKDYAVEQPYWLVRMLVDRQLT